MSAFCLGMAGSRAQPRGSGKMLSTKPVEDRLATSNAATKRDAEAAAAAENPDRPRVFLDLALGTKPLGRVVVELFSDIVPRTAENFRALCTGEKGMGDSGHPLHYKGCPFHRVVPGKAVQGGDIQRGTGKGGDSIYGLTFQDESFDLSHSSEGLLTMANFGRANTCNSQFMILMKPDASLDRRHVVFGRVVNGMDVVRRVEASCGVSDEKDKNTGAIGGAGVVAFRAKEIAVIADCGQLPSAGNEDDSGEPDEKRRKLDAGAANGGASEQVQLLHVLKKFTGCRRPETWRGEAAKCAKGKARMVVDNLRKRLVSVPDTGAAFREAARDHSDDASAQRGGDLGSVELSSLDKEVAAVARKLTPGELSEVFETPFGVHLLMRPL